MNVGQLEKRLLNYEKIYVTIMESRMLFGIVDGALDTFEDAYRALML